MAFLKGNFESIFPWQITALFECTMLGGGGGYSCGFCKWSRFSTLYGSPVFVKESKWLVLFAIFTFVVFIRFSTSRLGSRGVGENLRYPPICLFFPHNRGMIEKIKIALFLLSQLSKNWYSTCPVDFCHSNLLKIMEWREHILSKNNPRLLIVSLVCRSKPYER